MTKPGRPWLVACSQYMAGDDSHYGFGTVWIPYDRRGDFSKAWSSLQSSAPRRLLAWDSLSEENVALALQVVDLLFNKRWVAFHSLVVERSIVDIERHQGDEELGQRKHLTMFLTNKIERHIRKHGPRQEYRIWVSPLGFSYRKSDEVIEAVTNNVVSNLAEGRRNIRVSVRPREDAPLIQVCDTILGAIVAAWSAQTPSPAQQSLSSHVASHLGWDDLRADTYHSEGKFNIWKFHDPCREPARSATTRLTKRRIGQGPKMGTKKTVTVKPHRRSTPSSPAKPSPKPGPKSVPVKPHRRSKPSK